METFGFYTRMTEFERLLLNGVVYAQRDLQSEMDIFESKQDWTIKTMKGEPSLEQDEYAHSLVIFFWETVSHLEVLDMMSGEEDRENILRARATSNVVLTNPFRFLELNHLGVVLTLPVYRMGLPAEAIEVEHIQAPAEYLVEL
ncbi:hypothetical protein HPP92_006248 [Vanilla planifolia]|uniref:CHASE domain-containing protein n=1 Tax=Vanilla planifolia TaxID=51239 RepID=A0A835RTJ8_VANPL|nr:hypothetical protein HPP92_006248 [Vanilla planifolia]